MNILVERLFATHDALEGLEFPMRWAEQSRWPIAQRIRGTRHLDLNVFVGVDTAEQVLSALPAPIAWGRDDVETIKKIGQVRLER